MKDKEKKSHKGESVIGKIIYGFLLFAPLISIGITCLVNVFNNTEQQETTINYKYETNEVNSSNDLIVGNIYSLKITNYNLIAQNEPIVNTNYIYLNFESRIQEITFDSNYTIYKQINYMPYGDNYTNPKGYIMYRYDNLNLIINFVYLNNDYFTNNYTITKCENIPIESVETHGINRNDTFNYAINQVEENNLFNWSKNSIIYTGMYEFTQALNVTNTFIPMLLTYWLLISVIYFLYDIVLMLVLIIHDKIHCLQDSI